MTVVFRWQSLSIRVSMATRVSVKLAQPICVIQRNINVGRYQKFEGVLSRRAMKLERSKTQKDGKEANWLVQRMEQKGLTLKSSA